MLKAPRWPRRRPQAVSASTPCPRVRVFALIRSHPLALPVDPPHQHTSSNVGNMGSHKSWETPTHVAWITLHGMYRHCSVIDPLSTESPCPSVEDAATSRAHHTRKQQASASENPLPEKGFRRRVTPPGRRRGRYTREKDYVTREALYRAGPPLARIAHQ